MPEPLSFLTFGSTGFVGSHFLDLLLKSPNVSKVVSVSRKRPRQVPNSKLEAIVERDNHKWTDYVTNTSLPEHSIIFTSFGSALDTDYRVNMGMFKAAKESGKFDTAIVISAERSEAPVYKDYLRVKYTIDKEIQQLGFKRTFIIRPGSICSPGYTKEYVMRLKAASKGIDQYGTPIDIDEVINAVFSLAQQPLKKEGEITIIGGPELVSYAQSL